jgi:serine/threonine-protein phosphatase 2A activator
MAGLQRLTDRTSHDFSVPSKKIEDGDDLKFFFTSTAYRDLISWLLQLTRSMFPEKTADGTTRAFSLSNPPPFSPQVSRLRDLLQSLTNLLDEAPPDTGPRRFGNVAFRSWFRLAEERSPGLLQDHLQNLLPEITTNEMMRDELKAYLLGSFGSAQRLDYGTGHELSFVAFVGCLWKLNVFQAGEEQAIVIGVIQPYLDLVRKLILTYTLEPAGSHGVWGLDDHSFIPYIFGSAQFGPAMAHGDDSVPIPTEGSLPSAPSPSSVTNQTMVSDYKDSNMYFSAIQFIHDVKKGPFWEHSPVLYDISGIKDGWGKINKGMLKMYAAEVLGKFPVVQHFPFGSLFQWKADPEAQNLAVSIHAQQQPVALQSKDVPPVVSSGTTPAWTQAPMAAIPQTQASTGMPSTRAPWASAPASNRNVAPSMSARGVPSVMPLTKAPWARQPPPS